jgi:hypothetical protein
MGYLMIPPLRECTVDFFTAAFNSVFLAVVTAFFPDGLFCGFILLEINCAPKKAIFGLLRRIGSK